MLEMFLLAFLIRKIRKVAEAHGRSPKAMGILLFCLWWGFEIPAIAITIANGADLGGVLVASLLSASVGAIIAFSIASSSPRPAVPPAR